MRLPTVAVMLFLLVVAGLTTAVRGQDTVASEAIQARIDRLAETGTLTIEGAEVASADLLTRFYEVLLYGQAWQDPQSVEALLTGIDSSLDHGLDPENYHASLLRRMLQRTSSNVDAQADLDILLTDSAVRLLSHLWFGKVDPGAVNEHWNLDRPFLGGDPVQVVAAALANGRLGALIEEAQIDEPYYLTLKTALKSHREIASAGGWPRVPEGETLRLGMTDPRVPVLRKRLTRSGDYDGVSGIDVVQPAADATAAPVGEVQEGGDSDTAFVVEVATDPASTVDGQPELEVVSEDLVYGQALEAAVKTFQERHGIEVDGILGPNTLAAINVSVEERIDQIRVNLERARWVLRNLGQDYIVVNIAGFYVDVFRNGEQVWHGNTIVGQPFHKTPVFRDELSYIVLNPTWTAPRSIIVNELIPAQMKDFSYLERNNFILKDGSGQTLSPSALYWPAVSTDDFPYQVVQQPGDDNALGKVKFIFPNHHAIYLHDTPSRSLFGRAQRAFSHGCIRVQNPLDLAELLLRDQPDWSRERIDAVIASGQTTQVNITEKLPVLLLYWTVDPDPAGNVRFYTDVYDRDADVLAALDQR